MKMRFFLVFIAGMGWLVGVDAGAARSNAEGAARLLSCATALQSNPDFNAELRRDFADIWCLWLMLARMKGRCSLSLLQFFLDASRVYLERRGMGRKKMFEQVTDLINNTADMLRQAVQDGRPAAFELCLLYLKQWGEAALGADSFKDINFDETWRDERSVAVDEELLKKLGDPKLERSSGDPSYALWQTNAILCAYEYDRKMTEATRNTVVFFLSEVMNERRSDISKEVFYGIPYLRIEGFNFRFAGQPYEGSFISSLSDRDVFVGILTPISLDTLLGWLGSLSPEGVHAQCLTTLGEQRETLATGGKGIELSLHQAMDIILKKLRKYRNKVQKVVAGGAGGPARGLGAE